jgi:hypothetical protein
MAIRIAACPFRIASPTKVDRAPTKPSTARFGPETGNCYAVLPDQPKTLCTHIVAGNYVATANDTLSEFCNAVSMAANVLRCLGTSTRSATQVEPVRVSKTAVLPHQSPTLC